MQPIIQQNLDLYTLENHEKCNRKLIEKINLLDTISLYEYYNFEELTTLNKIKKYLDDIYYNGSKLILDDEKYDILKEILIKRDLNYKEFVGAEIKNKENKFNLPIWMGSMNKIKIEDDNKLSNWLKTNKSEKYIIEEKIDGVSCLLIFNKNGDIKILTRGNGIIGSDITYFLKYFNSIPKDIKKDLIIRGELVLYNNIFRKKFSEKYANARNFVSGRINGKKARKGIRDIIFISYEIISIKGIQIKPSEQLQYLDSLNFLTVNRNFINEISIENLSKLFINYKEKSKYRIDGIIIQSDKEYIRNIQGNPKYAFAFKMLLDTNIAKTEIEEVIWNVSKWGILKPQIKIKTVNLNGNKYNFTTGFNAKYIHENKIGKHTIVYITISGDVIPYILKIEKCSNKPDMPNIPYRWNDSEVDIICLNYDKMVTIKLCVSFFKKLNIKHLGEKCIEKIFNVLIKDENIISNKIIINSSEDMNMSIPENYLIILIKIISVDKNTLLKVEGFKELSVKRIQNNIKKGLENVSMSLILGASGVFGYGMAEKKINTLLENFPDVFKEYKNMNEKQLINRIIKINGFSKKSAKYIIKNIETADKFIEMIKPYVKFKIKINTKNTISKLKNLKIVFSGFRDPKLKELILTKGGKIMTNISSNTSILIVLDKNNIKSKTKKAIELNITILDKNEFMVQYF